MATTSNNALSQNKGGEVKGNENHMQGLFFDLLACLGGGDNPSLPGGFKQKPMTGFCEILEAFNETIKVRETGSGTVCEVGSSDIMSKSSSDGVISSSVDSFLGTSRKTLETPPEDSDSKCSDSVIAYSVIDAESENTDEQGRQSTSEQADDDDKNLVRESCESESGATDPEEDYVDPINNSEIESYAEGRHKIVKDARSEETKEKELLNQESTIASSQKDVAQEEKVKQSQILPERANCLPKPNKPQGKELPVEINPEYIDEVGPPLYLPTASSFYAPFPREVTALERELNRYSDEIQEIQRILKENIIPQPSSQFSREYLNVSPYPSTDQINSIQIGGAVVHSFTDEFATSNGGAGMYDDIMYDAESLGSPCNLNSPYHLSNYQSCTSFTSGQNQHIGNPYALHADNIQRTPSLYMDCVNLEETESDAEHFTKALKSINPSFVCVSAEGISELQKPLQATAPTGIADGESENDIVKVEQQASLPRYHEATASGEQERAFEKTNDNMDGSRVHYDFNGNDEAKFMDGEENSEVSSVSSKRKRKKKNYGQSVASSSDEEHLWTSASASDFEDLD